MGKVALIAIDTDLHKEAKLEAVTIGTTLKSYVEELIENDLIQKGRKEKTYETAHTHG